MPFQPLQHDLIALPKLAFIARTMRQLHTWLAEWKVYEGILDILRLVQTSCPAVYRNDTVKGNEESRFLLYSIVISVKDCTSGLRGFSSVVVRRVLEDW